MDRPRPTEAEKEKVNKWITGLSETGKVAEMDPMLLRSVLAEYGANFEVNEEARESLKKYSNLERRFGMNAVWGEDRVKNYRIWLKNWIGEYETRTDRPLPVLQGTDTKTSGGLKFFTDLTVFAAGLMDFESYKSLTEDRREKGERWQKRNPEDEVVPTPHSSFPPEFPVEAWNYLQKTR